MTDRSAAAVWRRSPPGRFLQASIHVARKDIASSLAAPVFTILSALIPVSYLIFLMIVVASGSRAPVAVVVNDRGATARSFVDAMAQSRSFRIKVVDEHNAAKLFDGGQVVGVVTIPATFGSDLRLGKRVRLPVLVNNLNVDFTDDIRRAIPMSITSFWINHYPADVTVQSREIDLQTIEPSYLQYLTVSSIVVAAALAGMLIAGTHAAFEHEQHTLKAVLLTPASRSSIQWGHVMAGIVLTFPTVVTLAVVTMLIVGALPVHPWELVGGLAMLMVLFVSAGNITGNILRRRAAVVPMVAGITFPLFAISGAFQPVSFGHSVIAVIAHFSPSYYGLALLQHACFGVAPTPQGTVVNALVILAMTVAAVTVGTRLMTHYEAEH